MASNDSCIVRLGKRLNKTHKWRCLEVPLVLYRRCQHQFNLKFWCRPQGCACVPSSTMVHVWKSGAMWGRGLNSGPLAWQQSPVPVAISPSLPIVFLVKREDSKCRSRHYLAHSGGQANTLSLWDPKEEGCYRQMVRALGAVEWLLDISALMITKVRKPRGRL